MNRNRRRFSAIALHSLIVGWCLLTSSHGADKAGTGRLPTSVQSHFSAMNGIPRGPNGGVIRILVDPGSPDAAAEYYLKIEKGDDSDGDGDVDEDDNAELNLNLVSSSGESEATVDDILTYLGYRDAGSQGISADRIERFQSDDLVSFTRFQAAVAAEGGDPSSVKAFADNDILATRYFAPKITDVAREREFFQYGWRKLVRFKSLAGSEARNRGVSSAFLLFNIFATEAHLKLEDTSPFNDAADPTRPNRSKQNQLILVRDPQAPGNLDDTVYWMVFGELPAGPLGSFLTASFDFRHPQVIIGRPTQDKYYVPGACADCHGDLEISKGKLNYLDTDHWFDRVVGVPARSFVDDFGAIAETAHGVLLDGGKIQTTAAFRVAFERIRLINEEIRDQNRAVDVLRSGEDNYDNFATRSVERWLQIHATNVAHIGILDDIDRDGNLDRAIQGDSRKPGFNNLWRKNDRIDEGLLPLMNRYCYRCHSSVRYSIYDRSRVRVLSSNGSLPPIRPLMQRYLSDPTSGEGVPFMPQDRPMTIGSGPSDRRRIVDLLDRLIDE